MTRFLLFASLCIVSSATQAQTPTGPFDCVIQPREIVLLSSAAEGVLIERLVERGTIVEAGQPVARLEDSRQRLSVELAALAATRDIEIQTREAAAQFRETELTRIEDLANRNLTPAIEIKRAELELRLARFGVDAAKLDQAIAQVELAEAEAELDRRTLKSSVSGVVIETGAAPGDYVNSQTTILKLARLDVLNVEVFLPTALYGLPVKGKFATVVPEDPVGGNYQAIIETVDRVFDAASGTFGTRLTIANPDYALPAGLRCSVTFPAR